ncbi:MAG TPA: hypothetical protein VFK33_00510 [Bacillales bacterium]|nr:hypothetical protein [Bacillales bacterium]
MRKMYIVVLVLFFCVVAGILYYSLTHQHEPTGQTPAGEKEDGAFILLDSVSNGV